MGWETAKVRIDLANLWPALGVVDSRDEFYKVADLENIPASIKAMVKLEIGCNLAASLIVNKSNEPVS